jgi:hypothetical protein
MFICCERHTFLTSTMLGSPDFYASWVLWGVSYKLKFSSNCQVLFKQWCMVHITLYGKNYRSEHLHDVASPVHYAPCYSSHLLNLNIKYLTASHIELLSCFHICFAQNHANEGWLYRLMWSLPISANFHLHFADLHLCITKFDVICWDWCSACLKYLHWC